MKIGFIGVGAMGGPMSRNIVARTNHEVMVFDLNPAAMEQCIETGAKRGASIAEVASSCEVVMMSLPTPKHVEAVIIGPGGVAENAKPGTVVIDLSTNSPTVIKRLGEALAAKGVALIEAPVTGGVIKATDGTLTIIAGGDEAVIDKQRPLLSSIGALVVYTGPHGSASVAKLVNNMMALCNSAVAAEGMMMARMSGVDLNKIVEVISNGSGNSQAFRGVSTRAMHGKFEPSFTLDLAYKDLGLAVELATEHGVPGMVAPQVLNLMRMARGMGLGQGDSTSVIKVYESVLGKEARLG
ncbi:NAD(P)-dependent oxidoreductase [Bradyrhizobium sp. LHD-71]|uniref:NAD(P)-dependent oxidoreductase n=1 Tax=Bradyrhizobium sp. LHD-71 TaxID=3072141 RepID=UPI00281028DA|nr:NAD(P)-dependent oxidoreductase [Bradyrhizobium sp. LHD-71]MDQ8730779.1 NAD(P)-dependent oxidoreductase [Bradyrhizobium sp. LHD-71]